MTERRLIRTCSRFLARPVLSVFIVALLVRVVVAVVSGIFHEGVLVPDEVSYLRIADLKSTGDLSLPPTQRCLSLAVADGTQYYCNYWQGLFNSTRTFSWPLTSLFWVFGPHRLLGQLLAGLAGATAAAVTARLATQLLRPPFGLGAGLVVALLPSQILFSSVALRESTIWLLLAGIGLLVSLSARQKRVDILVLSALGIGLLFVLLAWLRLQTAVLALWCVVPVFAIVGKSRQIRVLLAIGVLVVFPILVGVGPAGSGFIMSSIERLGYSRNVMSLGADTAFNYTAWSESGSSVVPSASNSMTEVQVGALNILSREVGSEHSTSSGGRSESGSSVVPSASNSMTEVQVGALNILSREVGALNILSREVGNESVSDTILILPSGLYNSMVRPVLWSVSDLRNASSSHAMAALEAPAWIVGYLFAGFGGYSNRRRLEIVGYPILFVIAIALSGAVTHGNLGTAFRHRGQIVFALAVLALAGVQEVVDGGLSAKAHWWRRERAVS